jgi:hypothetical protein
VIDRRMVPFAAPAGLPAVLVTAIASPAARNCCQACH